ncbi:MAG: 50S ribosomal protein L25 [Candidatus Microsaccharimonas sossegonensis]|uniref:Large ribosomal subunit protein bL25 n=1 Tax=Candidatus Microsaccharimonas sossegonensis TaxID=2506948 RepID=A0A4Q0AG94_9BACT|nr:MAG: 50S ribosomal protein L25 [Candidatus Microsaccharimonas sossegonensis]
MGDKINLSLDSRTLQGKKVRQLRKDGIIPAVVYGAGVEPINVQAPLNVINKVIRDAGKHTPVHLTIGSKKEIAMIKDVETDAVRGLTRHVSFHAVKQNEPVNAEVPIHLVGQGESQAEKAGLIVLQALDHIEVRALPLSLPEALEVTIANLKEAGDQITLGDITLPEGVVLVEHTTGREEDDEETPQLTDLVVASVYEPAALEAANDAAAGEATIDDPVESDNGSDSDQDSQAEEKRPGGKAQDDPKQSNVDANK